MIGKRLLALLAEILDSGSVIPSMYHGVILGMVKPYLQKTDDSTLRTMIERLRDEIIPWILDGNKNQ